MFFYKTVKKKVIRTYHHWKKIFSFHF